MRCAPALYTSLNRVKYPFDHNDEFLYTSDLEFVKRFDSKKKCYENSGTIAHAAHASIVSAAAPDLRSSAETFDTEKMRALLQAICYAPLILDQSIDTLILGCIGSGAFRNDPHVIAALFLEIIPNLKPYYKNIVFAIPDSTSTNYRVYWNVLKAALAVVT